jgi:hypothetical protein
MAEAEKRAAALLARMVAGYPLLLDRENQRTVATWAAKTVLTLQAVRDPDLIPAGAYRELRELERPPTGFRLALAMRPWEAAWPYHFTFAASAATLREWDVEPTFPGTTIDHYRAELCVGHLVIAVAAGFTPHARAVEQTPETIEIWPARVPLRWPPEGGLQRADPARIAA